MDEDETERDERQGDGSVIRQERLTREQRRALEDRLLRSGRDYREASWEKTARESLPEIHHRLDQLVGAPSRGSQLREARRVERHGRGDLPPGLRSRIHDVLGPLAHVRLLYSTKRHWICRVGLHRDEGVEERIVLVGPDDVNAVDSVRAAIDELSMPEQETVHSEAGSNDPFGDVHEVLDVEDIGPGFAEALAELGIQDTRQLWHAGADEIAQALDVPPKRVRRWQAQAELMALSGIGPQYAELLARVGVDGIHGLAEANAEDVAQRIQAKQDEVGVRIQGNVVQQGRVQGWIDIARNHEA